MITLSCNDLTLQLNPEVGGCVSSFHRGSTPILRPAVQGSTNPLDQAAYPLIPFSGRIDQGEFVFNKRKVTLPSNMPPEPHAIHGQGWQSQWQVCEQHQQRARVEFIYSGDDWPWRYRAEQTFELRKNSLTLSLALHNLSSEPMPAGLGWHPFFPKDDAQLTASVREIWSSSDDLITQSPVYQSEIELLRTGVAVSALDLDNAFTTEQQRSTMLWPAEARGLNLLASSELAHLVIYTPAGENFFCVEPVSHAPNCVNSTLPAKVTGAKILEPNQTMSATIALQLI